MKRLVFCCVILGLLLTVSLFSSATPYAGAQGLPTNTKRPVTLAPPATNTPRVATLEVPTAAVIIVTPTPAVTMTPTEGIGPVKYPENINSLTGLPFPNEEAKNRRNLIVKVSNYPWIVRPQSGLSLADLVYEYEVEGGVTRFAAIYRSQGTDFVGSIRSARLPDLELVVMYQALLAYSGANDNIKKMIGTADWKYLALTPQWGDNCPPFCRFPRPGVPFEHTLFGSTYKMWDLATRRNVNEGLPGRGFAFADTPDEGGKLANDIFIKWFGDQDARWQYNTADGKYYRWNTGTPHIDASTGQQLTADNIVVIEAYHVDRPDIYESEAGSPAIEVQLYGRQRAWIFRDGRWYEGQWVRTNRERMGVGLALYYADGQTPIHLKPGQTWVEVVRCCNMYGVTVSETLENVNATATFAQATTVLRGPRVFATPAEATAVYQEALSTRAASAATQGVPSVPTLAAPQQPSVSSSTKPASTPQVPAGTPQVVGLVPTASKP